MALICLVLAFVLALLAAAGVPSSRINLVGAALAAYFLSLLVTGLH